MLLQFHIPILIQLLIHGDNSIQECVLDVLCFLCLNNLRNQEAVLNSDNLDVIANLLNTQNVSKACAVIAALSKKKCNH